MFLGVVADDLTGATDVASMLRRAGMRTVLSVGLPTVPALSGADEDAHIVALKSRTAPTDEAVAQSRAAADWLLAAGCRRLYLKYCSTFDSTPRGNIGPVTDALLRRLSCAFTVACPALPENGRTVYQGYLFVDGVLLGESGMRHHPLTPMTDSSVVRLMAAQSEGPVGLVTVDHVRRGPAAVRERFDGLRADGVRVAVLDAIGDADLGVLGEACAELPLVTAGSGIATGLARAYQARGWVSPRSAPPGWSDVHGAAAVIAGSCSATTVRQVRAWRRAGGRAVAVDATAAVERDDAVDDVLARAVPGLADGPVLVYSTQAPQEVRVAQRQWGAELVGRRIEAVLAGVARGLVAHGVERLVVAGGETSGAVVSGLGVQRLWIGREIEPGVPWTRAEGRPLLLALKSGNFGSADFFATALGMGAG